MSLTRNEPVNLFDQFNDEINRYLAGRRAANQERDWVPAVDIQEDDTGYLLTADIPGVNRDAVELILEDGVLTVKGERKPESTAPAGGHRHRERVQGTFARQFALPDTVDGANISASVRDGVLCIRIPRQEKALPKKITVN
jgi:HSP20 family protein